ncbi:uncharacterized protein LOC131855267 [Achroia grisella]|uniref:uncharacterized protein LOC131855267 n=1 Tax=Achroia grisella TaxID=688607 RepID=UPI0027D3340E|nr:uncharacterized protein LOC131855267 [Achroia grisella]
MNSLQQTLPRTFHHYKLSDTDTNVVICKVCNVEVLNTQQSICNHEVDYVHTKHYKQLLLNNYLVINEGLYCGICDIILSNQDDLDHMNDENHVNEKECVKLHPHMLKKEGSTLECYVCDVTITSNNCVTEHVNGNQHRDKYSQLCENNNITEVNNRKFCELCLVFVNDRKVIDHINDDYHCHRLNLDYEDTDNETNLSDTSSEDDSIGEPLNYQMKECDITNSVLCIVCNITIDDEDITTHISGNKHKHIYAATLSFNELKSLDNGFFCDICKVSVSNKNEFSHINGRKHKENIENVIFESMTNRNM